MKRALAIACAVVLFLWAGIGSNLESFINRTGHGPLPPVSAQARALHDSSWVADLHADSLLFGRNLLRRSNVGHVDLPRLVDGGVSFQIFGAPTVTPWSQNFDGTDGDAFDALTLAGVMQLSHYLWNGPRRRAEHMASTLHRMARDSHGGLMIVRTRADFAALRRRQAAGEPVIGSLLAIEGAHAAESTSEGLRRLHDAGYRMIGLAHFFDNDYGGSAHGLEKGGLTPLGRRTLAQMEALGIILDVAHLSPTAIDDALAIATKPVVVSHGGVKGTCDNLRTLSDAHVRGIAATGGVIGIGYFEGTICGNTPDKVAAAARYIVDLVGDEHAALGSDYDGAIVPGFDTSQLVHVTQALLDVGLAPESIQRILGENLARVLEAALP
jgi:microsomal dipeptidase-like Zn-dependent dipeptidase